MRTLRPLALAIAVLLPASAFAQLDDDLLAPLTDEPAKKKKKRAPKKEKKEAPKKAEEKKEAPADDLLLESLVSNKTELLVKLPSGFKGAQLAVDGKEMGEITGGAVEVTPGEHTVTIKRIGYADFTKKVTVAPNKVTEVPASLEPVAGVLAMSVEPSDAEVLVDGKVVGQGNVKDIPLIPGNRTITVRKQGLQDERVTLAVKPGKEYPLSIVLKAAPKIVVAENADRPENTSLRDPNLTTTEETVPLETETSVEGETPMYKRWYVWAGIGAVVAGAAAGAYAMSQSSGGGTSGGVTPTSVCGGECDGTINWPGMRF